MLLHFGAGRCDGPLKERLFLPDRDAQARSFEVFLQFADASLHREVGRHGERGLHGGAAEAARTAARRATRRRSRSRAQ